jgi:hypothetical protein
MVDGLCAIQILQQPFARRGLINQFIRYMESQVTILHNKKVAIASKNNSAFFPVLAIVNQATNALQLLAS